MLLLVWRRKLWGFGGRPQDADILPASQIENSGGEMIKRLIHWLILWWARWSFVVSLDHVHYVLRCLIYRLDLCTDRNVQRGVGYSHAWIPCYTLLICNYINIQPWMSYVSAKSIDTENNLVLDVQEYWINWAYGNAKPTRSLNINSCVCSPEIFSWLQRSDRITDLCCTLS